MKSLNSKKIFPFVNYSKAKVAVLLIIFSFFFVKGITYFDPDFGWRIKAGEYYYGNGIPKTDIFSYTMSDFPWVDHAWGTTLIFYLFYEFLGYPTLVFFMSLLVLASLLFISKSVFKFDLGNAFYKEAVLLFHPKIYPKIFLNFNLKNIYPFSFFPLILVISIFFTFFGVRAQVVSWFMFSILIHWLSEGKIYEKYRFFLPAFFLVWANLHGSFVLGILALFLYLSFEFLKIKKISLSDSLTGLSSFIVTFINPYGTGVWREAWSSASDSNLRMAISEWMPALTMFDLAMVFLICLSLIFIWKYRKKYTLFELTLFIFLFSQAITSRRQLPLWAVFIFPLVVRGFFFFWKGLERIVGGQRRFVRVYVLSWIVSVLIFFIQAFFTYKGVFYIGKGNFYPVSAVTYLSQNIPEGEIFSSYGWGGYLIQNLPQKKVFVDGRMPSWSWNSVNQNNLSSAFGTYNDILSGEEDYKVIFEKYGVDTVLLNSSTELEEGEFLEKAEDLLESFGWEKNDFNFIEALEEDGWIIVYEDETSVMYKKD